MMSKSARQAAPGLVFCEQNRAEPALCHSRGSIRRLGPMGHPKLSAKLDAVPRLICLTCVL